MADPQNYVRMLPVGGLVIGRFTYKDWPDVDEIFRFAQNNWEVTTKLNDVNYQEAISKVSLSYTKSEITEIMIFVEESLVGSVFLAKTIPPFPGFDSDKGYLNGVTPASTTPFFSKDYIEGAFRILRWLYLNGIVNSVGAVLVEKKIDGKWESSSRWCAMHTPGLLPRREVVLDDTLDGGNTRIVCVSAHRSDIPNLTDAQVDTFFSNWTFRDSPWKVGGST